MKLFHELSIKLLYAAILAGLVLAFTKPSPASAHASLSAPAPLAQDR